jgi:hypothetical protein
MKKSTLSYLHERFLSPANIAPIDDTEDQDKATRFYESVPDEEEIHKQAKDALYNIPDEESDDYQERESKLNPDLQGWNPGGTTFAKYTDDQSMHHNMFEKMGFRKDGGANTDNPNHTKHKYSLGVEQKAGSSIAGVHTELTKKGYDFSDGGDGTSGFWSKGRHKISVFRDRSKGTATLIHRQPKQHPDAYNPLIPTQAAIYPESKYSWYEYQATKGTSIESSRKTLQLKKGSLFGVRDASSKKNVMRLIAKDLGPTHVFSTTQAQHEKLVKASKSVRTPKMSVAASLPIPTEASSFLVEAAPKKYQQIMDTMLGIFRKAKMPIEARDPIRISPASRNAGLLVTITSQHTDITFKRMMALRAYLTHHFKAVDLKVSPGAVGSKMSLTYFVTVKYVKKDGDGKQKFLTPRGAKVSEKKPAAPVKSKKYKHLTPLPLKKFSKKKLQKKLKSHSSLLDSAVARVEAYANKQFGMFESLSGKPLHLVSDKRMALGFDSELDARTGVMEWCGEKANKQDHASMRKYPDKIYVYVDPADDKKDPGWLAR